MDQLLKSLNELHQAASSVCQHLQQIPASVGGGKKSSSNSQVVPSSASQSRAKQLAGSHQGWRVHFGPPWASISNSFVQSSTGTGKGGKQPHKKGKQDEGDEERILISEVSDSIARIHACS